MKKIISNLNSVGRKVAGILMLVVGIGVAVLLAVNLLKDFPLWVLGKSVDGVVVEKWYELIDENQGELTFTYHVGYSFTTPEGVKLEGNSRLGASEWSALVYGGDVRVLYSPLDPSNNRIDDSRFRPLLACTYVPFALLAWFLLYQGWELLTAEIILNKPDLWRLENKED